MPEADASMLGPGAPGWAWANPASPPGPSPRVAPAITSSLIDDQRSFASVLARTGVGTAAITPGDPARDAAEQLVAVALVQPILAELRDSDTSAPPFAPTQGERQFRALMDAELAQRVVKAARFPLVDRLARELRRGPPAATTIGPTEGP